MASYVIAPRRGTRPAEIGCDWAALLDPIPGVHLRAGNPRRAVVDASAEALDAAREALGSDYRIEPVIEHRTSTGC